MFSLTCRIVMVTAYYFESSSSIRLFEVVVCFSARTALVAGFLCALTNKIPVLFGLGQINILIPPVIMVIRVANKEWKKKTKIMVVYSILAVWNPRADISNGWIAVGNLRLTRIKAYQNLIKHFIILWKIDLTLPTLIVLLIQERLI